MVLDFDMTCVIQAWGSPQVEGKMFQNKMESKDYFSPRMDVLFHCASYAMTNDWVPQFTRVGFEKSRIPDHLYEMILTEYEEMKKTPTTPEACEPVILKQIFLFLHSYNG